MTLLIIYLVLAIGVSFVCSLCEAVLLTLTISDAEVMTRAGKRAGSTLRRMKDEVDRPLAAILTLNTIAHTVGAAGVGAQSIVVFGEAWIGVVSAALTLLVLVVSEIIPKTIGASYARPLAPQTTLAIVWMIWLTYPVVVALNALSSLLRGKGEHGALSREQIEVIAELARTGGAIAQAEHAIITNMLKMQDTPAESVMTPRTVLVTLPKDTPAHAAFDDERALRFSRIPVTGEGPDDVLGIVLKHDLHRAIIDGHRERRVDEMLRPIVAVPEQASLLRVMEQFGETGQHMFLVVDEFGGTSGIVTLEDVLETILGEEIIDETDPVADMRELAERKGRASRKQHNPPT